jgi:hypothetical protein
MTEGTRLRSNFRTFGILANSATDMLATRSANWLWWWAGGYVIVMGAVVGSMIWERHSVLTEMSTPSSLANWEVWREDVRQQQGNPGPVERRVPKSDEPPALVLMRDYFAVSMVGATFFTSLLYWIGAWFVTGALGGVSK